MSAPRRFNPWMWLPVLVIGAAAIPNLVLIAVARKARISKVEEQPWLAAGRIDQDKERARAFAAAGGRLSVTATGRSITCRLEAPPATGATIRCYRPSDAALDRSLPWSDPSRPLDAVLPADGHWVLGLEVDGSVVATHALILSP